MAKYSGLLIICAAATMNAQAASAQSAASTGDSDGTQIETIIVSAQRRSEDVQKVPISIATVSADRINQIGITDQLSLGRAVPGLVTTTEFGFNLLALRGIGVSNTSAGNEPVVATYVDGIYQGSFYATVAPYNFLDHIEVLRGPQGTLYGRNATGGLMNVVTLTPGQTPVIQANLSYGSYSTIDGGFYAGGPVTDSLSADIAVTVKEQEDGLEKNLATGDRVGKYDYLTVRSKWHYDFSADTTADFSMDYANADSTAYVGYTVFPGTTPLFATDPDVHYSGKPYEFYSQTNPIFNTSTGGASLKLVSNFDSIEFVSLTGYRYTTAHTVIDADGSDANGIALYNSPDPAIGAVGLASLNIDQRVREPYFVTQEFQLQSTDTTSPLSWITGVYLQANNVQIVPNDFQATAGVPFVEYFGDQITQAVGVYMQGTYKLTDKLSATAGLRYSAERKSTAEAEYIDGDFTAADTKNHTFQSLSYKFSLQYAVSDDTMLYASASRGYKSGIYNLTAIDNSLPTKEEQLDSYEAGWKSEIAPWLRLNVSGYYYNYKNLQTFLLLPDGSSALQNAPLAKLYGGDIDLDAIVLPGLDLTIGLAAQHNEYVHFSDAAGYVQSPFGGMIAVQTNVAGNQLERAPFLTTSIGLNYTKEFSGVGKLMLNSNLYYSSSYPFEPDNIYKQPAYATLDLSATWAFPGDEWSVTAWGRNVTDTRYFSSFGENTRGVFVGYAYPATGGLKLSFNY